MKRYVTAVAIALVFVTILSVGTLSGGSDVWAQDKGGTLAQQIQGSGLSFQSTTSRTARSPTCSVPIREAS
jgi:hypothetical protein